MQGQHRHDQQRADDQRRLEPLGDALAARVHPAAVRRRRGEVLPLAANRHPGGAIIELPESAVRE